MVLFGVMAMVAGYQSRSNGGTDAFLWAFNLLIPVRRCCTHQHFQARLDSLRTAVVGNTENERCRPLR